RNESVPSRSSRLVWTSLRSHSGRCGDLVSGIQTEDEQARKISGKMRTLLHLRPEWRPMQSALKFILTLAVFGALVLGAQAPPNFDNVQIKVLPVQSNVYMVAGAGGNITLQVGKEGVLMVDTEYAPLAPRIMAEIRKLSKD